MAANDRTSVCCFLLKNENHCDLTSRDAFDLERGDLRAVMDRAFCGK